MDTGAGLGLADERRHGDGLGARGHEEADAVVVMTRRHGVPNVVEFEPDDVRPVSVDLEPSHQAFSSVGRLLCLSWRRPWLFPS